MMPQNLSGNALYQYTGVTAPTPPNFLLRNRAPTNLDWQGYNIGDEWMDNLSSSATYRSVWKNVGIQPQNAIWVLMTSGGGDLTALTADDGLVALPNALGRIKIAGDRDITTNAATANQVQITLNNTISLGDLAVVPQGTVTLDVQTGDVDVDAGQLNVAASYTVDDFTAYVAKLTNSGNNQLASRLFFQKHRNGAAVQVGDGIGTLRMSAFDGTQYTEGAYIQTQVDAGTIASGRLPTKINFATHPDSVTAPFGGPSIRMVIGSEGNVTINNPVSGAGLTVNGSAAGVTSLLISTGDIEVSDGDVNVDTGNVTVIGDGSATGTFTAFSISNNTTGPAYFCAKNRSGGVITSGDDLGSYNFTGSDGTNNITASRIVSTNSGTVAANRIASNLRFFTHPDSITATTERMVIASTGEVTINAPDSGVALTVAGTVKGTTLYATGDAGGVAATNALSNVSSTTIGAGVGSIAMSSANPATNTAWLKIYIGNTAYWIPCWATNSP